MLGPFVRALSPPAGEKELARLWTALIAVPAAGYWASHADFGRPLSARGAADVGGAALVGASRAGDMVVNVLLPLLVAYGERNGRGDLAEAALRVYASYPKLADNRITRAMAEEALGPRKAGSVSTARRQQGLIHLYRLYCEARRCYECPLSGLARR
jgi:hypothetical protein